MKKKNSLKNFFVYFGSLEKAGKINSFEPLCRLSVVCPKIADYSSSGFKKPCKIKDFEPHVVWMSSAFVSAIFFLIK